MGKFADSIQPATKKETGHITVYTLIGLVIMWIAFWVLKWFFDGESPFDYTVLPVRLGGIGGGIIAVLNFFLMAMTVQKIASTEDDKEAQSIMKTSYRNRMLLQILWIVVAFVTPCFNCVAGIAPLLFPTLGIKIKGIIDLKKYSRQEVEQK